MVIQRKTGSQDISWFLDQHRLGRIDLNPPYQRKSVWTSGDRRYFLDTIFHDFPCPPLYLHKTIDAKGAAIYHVVDGKQRVETVIKFATENRIRLPTDFGDDRLNNKRWKDIQSDVSLRNLFLNYTFIVEYFDDLDSSLVNEIFERMNKNSRKLTRQELRHARYDGWFSREVDSEVEDPIWRTFGVATPGRARRMADAQFIAELSMVIISNGMIGFNHDKIDETYATYDDVSDPDLDFDPEAYKRVLRRTKKHLEKMNEENKCIETFFSSANMYSLWALLVKNRAHLPADDLLARRYKKFMTEVTKISEIAQGGLLSEEELQRRLRRYSSPAIEYFQNNQSATTESPQRERRLSALEAALLK